MDKIVFFDNKNQTHDVCNGKMYNDFIDYAFENTDYFMLVYVNYYAKGYSKKQKYFIDALKKYKVKSRTNPSWPGTLKTLRPNTTYKIVFYKTEPEAKKILNEVNALSDWSRPSMPEDLAFFKGNQCWFYSVGHEKISAIIHANESDINFLESKGLIKVENVLNHKDNYYDQYDEELP